MFRSRLGLAALFPVIAALAIFLLLSGSASAGVVGKINKGLDILPVVIRGEALPGLLGARIEGIRAYAWGRDGFGRICLQIDERNDDGEYVIEGFDAWDENPGLLDKNDEVVFRGADVGRRVSRLRWPEEILAGREVRVADPVTHESFYAYLFYFDDPPPQSGRRYVSYDHSADAVVTSMGKIGFDRRHPELVSHFSSPLYKADPARNLIDCQKAEARIRLLGGLFNIVMDEKDFDSKLLAVKVGPIRVIRWLNIRANLAAFLPVFNVDAAFLIYENYVAVPIVSEMPFLVSLILSELTLDITIDMNLYGGTRVFMAGSPEGVLVDGVMTHEEKRINGREGVWIAMQSEGFYGMGAWSLDGASRTPLTSRLSYDDDEAALEGDEKTPGHAPKIGFSLSGLSRTGNDTLKIDITLVVIGERPAMGGGGLREALAAPPDINVTEGREPEILALYVKGYEPHEAILRELTGRSGNLPTVRSLGLEETSPASAAREVEKALRDAPDIFVLLEESWAEAVAPLAAGAGLPVAVCRFRPVDLADGDLADNDKPAHPAERPSGLPALLRKIRPSLSRIVVPRLAGAPSHPFTTALKEQARRAGVVVEEFSFDPRAPSLPEKKEARPLWFLPFEAAWAARNYFPFSGLAATARGAGAVLVSTTEEAAGRGAVLSLDPMAKESADLLSRFLSRVLKGGAGGDVSLPARFIVNGADAAKAGIALPRELLREARESEPAGK